MPRISRIPLKPRELQHIRSALLKAIALLRTTSDVEEFLLDFLTPTEWKMFMKRLAIAGMLLAGKPYGEIGGALGVSNGTIARVQNVLHSRGRGMRKIIALLK